MLVLPTISRAPTGYQWSRRRQNYSEARHLHWVKWGFPRVEGAFLCTSYIEIVSMTEYKCWQLTALEPFNKKGASARKKSVQVLIFIMQMNRDSISTTDMKMQSAITGYLIKRAKTKLKLHINEWCACAFTKICTEIYLIKPLSMLSYSKCPSTQV